MTDYTPNTEEIMQLISSYGTIFHPFIESDTGDITGPGHQDKEAFATAINAYDRSAGEASTLHDASHVKHQWARITDEKIVTCDKADPDAIPVTTIWGVR